jgi:hypothetical protein
MGKPDLFITMTTNPHWPEILENLLPGQTANDGRDLVAQVFHIKFTEMLINLQERQVLERIVAAIYTIEFQKRGSPHAHVQVILAENDKLHTESEIDRIVTAEIRDEFIDPELFACNCEEVYVVWALWHQSSPNRWQSLKCCKRPTQPGVCTDKFPRSFQAETTVIDNGFPQYLWRDNGQSVTV